MNFEEVQRRFARYNIDVFELDGQATFELPDGGQPISVVPDIPEEVKPDIPDRTCVLVFGLPRGGTSAVAGVLHHLGVMMGPYTLSVNRHNSKGYFENSDFVEFHSSFVGSGIDHWLDTKMMQTIYSFTPEARDQYARLIAYHEKDDLWGFKDLRVYHFLAEFLELVESQIKIINVLRFSDAVISSMSKYPGMKEADPMQVYQGWTNLRAYATELVSQYHISQLVIHYEQLVRQPEQVVSEVAGYVGVPVTEQAIEFIDPELNHFGEEP